MAMTKRAEYMVMVTIDEGAYHINYDRDKRPIIVRVDGDYVRVELNATIARQGAFTISLSDLRKIVADADNA